MPKFYIDDNLPIGTPYKTRSGKRAIYGGIDRIKGHVFFIGNETYYTDSQGMYNHRFGIDGFDIIGFWEEETPNKSPSKIVSMLLHDNYVYVATEYEVFNYKDGKWETILKVKDLK